MPKKPHISLILIEADVNVSKAVMAIKLFFGVKFSIVITLRFCHGEDSFWFIG